jgi:hypothetical protein
MKMWICNYPRWIAIFYKRIHIVANYIRSLFLLKLTAVYVSYSNLWVFLYCSDGSKMCLIKKILFVHIWRNVSVYGGVLRDKFWNSGLQAHHSSGKLVNMIYWHELRVTSVVYRRLWEIEWHVLLLNSSEAEMEVLLRFIMRCLVCHLTAIIQCLIYILS